MGQSASIVKEVSLNAHSTWAIGIEFICQMFPPKAKWSTNQIPDLAGKVAIVTGANTGYAFSYCLLRTCH